MVEESGGETEGGAGPDRGEQIGEESSPEGKSEAEEEWKSPALLVVVVVVIIVVSGRKPA